MFPSGHSPSAAPGGSLLGTPGDMLTAVTAQSEPPLRAVHVAHVRINDLPDHARTDAIGVAYERAAEPWANDAPWLAAALVTIVELSGPGEIMVPVDDEVTRLFDILDMLSRDEDLAPSVREIWRRVGAAIDWT
jgi:hypothetical protein